MWIDVKRTNKKTNFIGNFKVKVTEEAKTVKIKKFQ